MHCHECGKNATKTCKRFNCYYCDSCYKEILKICQQVGICKYQCWHMMQLITGIRNDDRKYFKRRVGHDINRGTWCFDRFYPEKGCVLAYRSDTRDPGEIFRNGFQTKAVSRNFFSATKIPFANRKEAISFEGYNENIAKFMGPSIRTSPDKGRENFCEVDTTNGSGVGLSTDINITPLLPVTDGNSKILWNFTWIYICFVDYYWDVHEIQKQFNSRLIYAKEISATVVPHQNIYAAIPCIRLGDMNCNINPPLDSKFKVVPFFLFFNKVRYNPSSVMSVKYKSQVLELISSENSKQRIRKSFAPCNEITCKTLENFSKWYMAYNAFFKETEMSQYKDASTSVKNFLTNVQCRELDFLIRNYKMSRFKKKVFPDSDDD